MRAELRSYSGTPTKEPGGRESLPTQEATSLFALREPLNTQMKSSKLDSATTPPVVTGGSDFAFLSGFHGLPITVGSDQ